jgi:hypothetical protein
VNAGDELDEAATNMAAPAMAASAPPGMRRKVFIVGLLCLRLHKRSRYVRKVSLNLTDGVPNTDVSRGGGEAGRGCAAPATAAPGDTVMTKDRKIIRTKAGLLELTKQLSKC